MPGPGTYGVRRRKKLSRQGAPTPTYQGSSGQSQPTAARSPLVELLGGAPRIPSAVPASQLTQRAPGVSARPTTATRGPRAEAPKPRTERQADLPGLDPAQEAIVNTILQVGDKLGATEKEKLAAIETGIVESNFTNYTDQALTDLDSLGWRQERTSQYGTGPKGATNVRAGARRFFQEARTDPGTSTAPTPGLLAQAVQGSAFPERYDAVQGQAQQILAAAGGKGRVRRPLSIAELFHDPGTNIADGQPTSAIGGHGSHVHFASENPRDVLRAAKIAQRQGLDVRENPLFDPVDPVHTGGSHHYQVQKLPKRLVPLARRLGGTGREIGEAIDVNAGTPEELLAYNEDIARRGGGAVLPSSGSTYVPPAGGVGTGVTSSGGGTGGGSGALERLLSGQARSSRSRPLSNPLAARAPVPGERRRRRGEEEPEEEEDLLALLLGGEF